MSRVPSSFTWRTVPKLFGVRSASRPPLEGHRVVPLPLRGPAASLSLGHGTVEALPHPAELVLEVLNPGRCVSDPTSQDGDLLFESSDNTLQPSGVSALRPSSTGYLLALVALFSSIRIGPCSSPVVTRALPAR